MMNVYIEKIEITSFGKLKGVSINAKSGINLFYADNESGKSTIASFVKFILYGFTGERKQSIAENEKKLYTPWDNPRSAGSIVINKDGVSYRTTRSVVGGKEELEVIESATGKKAFDGMVPGKALFGVSEEVFSHTLFFRQLTLPEFENKDLEEHLQSIAVSADEQVSAANALKKLTEMKNDLFGRAGKGRIPETENECDELEREILNSETISKKLSESKTKLSGINALLTESLNSQKSLEAERKSMEGWEAKLRLEALNAQKSEVVSAQSEYEKAAQAAPKADIGALREAERAYREATTRVEEAEIQLSESNKELSSFDKGDEITKEQVEKYKKSLSSCKTIKLLSLTICVFAVIGCVVCALMQLGLPLIIGCAVLAVISGAFAVFGFAKANRVLKNASVGSERELNQKLSEADAKKPLYEEKSARVKKASEALSERKRQQDSARQTIELALADIPAENGDYSKRITQAQNQLLKAESAKNIWEFKKSSYEKALEGVDITELTALAESAQEPKRDKKTLETQLNFHRQRIAIFNGQVRDLELEIASLEAQAPGLAQLKGRLDEAQNRLCGYKKRFEAVKTAIEILTESSDEMKKTVAPRISAQASEYFCEATAQKYHGIDLKTTLAMSFEDSGAEHSSDFLSAGTRDSAYISMRLALADILFDESGVFLILDDAFGRLDNNRLRCIMKALYKASKRHQIFVFSCNDREKQALDTEQIPYQTLEFN